MTELTFCCKFTSKFCKHLKEKEQEKNASEFVSHEQSFA